MIIRVEKSKIFSDYVINDELNCISISIGISGLKNDILVIRISANLLIDASLIVIPFP